MEELYRRISALEHGKEHELVTVLTGDHAGEKVLFTEGDPVWPPSMQESELEVILSSGDLLREKIGHVRHLVVCGGGFVGQAVIRGAVFLGWKVTAVDDREEYAGLAKKAGAFEAYAGPFSKIIKELSPDPDTCYVVVTREHSCDRECLDEILKKPFGYLGVMGSHSRAARLKESLRAAGVREDLTERINAPIGLAIGAQTPEEIAVSILAQIIQYGAQKEDKNCFPDKLMRAILALYAGEKKQYAVLATIASRKGSAPRKAGTRMLVCPDGTCVGTIGGGTMEGAVIERAAKLLKDPGAFRPCLFKVDLTGRSGEHADMLCGGITEIFLELLGG